MKRVLIIKTGRTETFAHSVLDDPSLGDVLRSTVLLHCFNGSHVTWVTAEAALPLLAGNPLVDEVLPESLFFSGIRHDYDVIVNLERAEKWTKWLASAGCGERYGFGTGCGELRGLAGASWQAGLFRLVGREWQGEEYVPPAPGPRRIKAGGTLDVHDVGLNWRVGTKWPEKAWPRAHWEALAGILSERASVSWQTGFGSLTEYSFWISRCRTIISTDSLGLHLGLALGKSVVALFGPTSPSEVPLYGRGLALAPGMFRGGVEEISPEEVAEAYFRLHGEEARAWTG